MNDYYNNSKQPNDFPYFEDYHSGAMYSQPAGDEATQPPRNKNTGENLYPESQNAQSFDKLFHKKETKNFQNLMVYEPKSEIDSKTIIDFLKRKEPTIVNLEKANPSVSQRILDFVAGAVYALNGTVHRVSGNIFLLSPNGVEVTVPYEVDDEK